MPFGSRVIPVVLVAVGTAWLTVVAQTPAPPQGAPPPAATTPSAAGPAGPAPQGGRGQAGAGRGSDPFEGADLSPKEPITAVSPAEEQKRFVLPPGYRIEPVLTEPDI